MAEEEQNKQERKITRLLLNEAEKSVDVTPVHASSQDSTVDQGFSSNESSTDSNERTE